MARYGLLPEVPGFRDDAANCVKQVLKMDKEDQISAERLAASVLVLSEPAEAARAVVVQEETGPGGLPPPNLSSDRH